MASGKIKTKEEIDQELLPESVKNMAELIGLEDTMKIVEKLGGIRFFVPKKLDGSNFEKEFSGILKKDSMVKISNTFAGESVIIPSCRNYFSRKKHREILSKYDSGVSVKNLAKEYNLGERVIYTILKKAL